MKISHQFKFVKLHRSRILRQMLLMTFVYSSPAPNLWSDMRPRSVAMRFLMLTRLRFCPSDFELKKVKRLLRSGW